MKDGSQFLSPELRKLVEDQEKMRWLFVNRLQKDDKLDVQTRNTIYNAVMTDPANGVCLIKNNSTRIPIPDFVEACIGGSTLTGTGTMLKLHGIAIGLRLVVFVTGIGELILSHTEKVWLNGDLVHMEND